jgi:uncharacterized membrane protein
MLPEAVSHPQRTALLRSLNLWIGVTVCFFFTCDFISKMKINLVEHNSSVWMISGEFLT